MRLPASTKNTQAISVLLLLRMVSGPVGGGVFAVFFDLDLGDPGAIGGLCPDEGGEDLVDVPGEAFAGAVGQDVGLEKVAGRGEQGVFFRVVLIEEAGVIEVFVDPGFKVFEVAEVDDKAVGIGLAAGEGEGDRPVVPVDLGAVSGVEVLAVGERDVAVGFFAGEHDADGG